MDVFLLPIKSSGIGHGSPLEGQKKRKNGSQSGVQQRKTGGDGDRWRNFGGGQDAD